MRIRRHLPLPALIVALVVSLVPAAAFAQDGAAHASLVTQDPANGTPRLLGSAGEDMAAAISEVDGWVMAGGRFSVAKQSGGTEYPVGNLAIWRTSANVPLPAPVFDRDVLAIEPAADRTSWYVGGTFTTVDGVARRALVRVRRDGTVDPTFKPVVQWRVRDLALVGDVLYVGGDLAKVGGVTTNGLIALDATTGKPVSDWAPVFGAPFSTSTRAGYIYVERLDASDDGTRLVVAGNFGTVDGAPRGRVALFDIAGQRPTLMDWHVPGLAIPQCRSNRAPQFIYDIDVAPSGDWVAVATGGAYTGGAYNYDHLCDALSRFELQPTGAQQPTWVNHSGGDTLTGVKVTGDVVYVGGHQRWMNNSWRADAKGSGAVLRNGIAAVHAANGIPFSWNPGRDPRGLGAYELTTTPSGLWVGSDTDYIGGKYTAFAAFLPLAGGTNVPSPGAGTLPATVQLVQNGDDERRLFTGTTSTARPSVASAVAHSNLGGVTSVGSEVLAAYTDGKLLRHGAGGDQAGTAVDLAGLDTSGRFKVSSIRALGYDEQRGELLYRLNGNARLYARGYNPESGVVSALERVVSPGTTMSWSDVVSILVVDGVVYAGRIGGTLVAMPYTLDGPLEVQRVTVAGPGVDGLSWSKPAFIVDAGAPRRNLTPIANLDVDCTGRTCWIDAGDSYDPMGAITSYQVVATGAGGSATLDAASGPLTLPGYGLHTLTLTVTDAAGVRATATREHSVPAPPLTLLATAQSNRHALAHSVTAPAAADGSFGLLTMSIARPNVLDTSTTTPSGPDGWTLVTQATAGQLHTVVWRAPIDAADAGSVITVPLTTANKAHLALTVWAGVSATSPIMGSATSSAVGSRVDHTSPVVTTPGPATIVELYSMKSSTISDWVPPTGTTTVVESHGTSGGHISTLVVQSSAAAGSVGGRTATADVADDEVATVTIALRPA